MTKKAVQGLVKRMNGLIAFSKLRAERMLPFAEANDRPHVEPIGLESATECAKVTADVIHTLVTLAWQAPEVKGASLIAEVSAPPVAGMDVVPAKLMLLGTNYSTLSEPLVEESHAYRGIFSFRKPPARHLRRGRRAYWSTSLVCRTAGIASEPRVAFELAATAKPTRR